jgi:hypothetical protein
MLIIVFNPQIQTRRLATVALTEREVRDSDSCSSLG